MVKSKWIKGVVRCSCLLLASCDENTAPAEMAHSEAAEPSNVPVSLPTMTIAPHEALINYNLTRKEAEEKADVVTRTYGTNSVQYALITTVAVMQLVDQGKVDLDTPVVHYIRDFDEG